MVREQLALQIYEISHLTGSFELRSGAVSNEYFDKYQFESRPKLLDAIAKNMQEIILVDFHLLAGLEMGGIPIAVALSLETAKTIVFVRKKSKEYGTRKFAEGPDINGRILLIVEDVVTSGGQILHSVEDLRKEGAIITDAVCVIDREAGGKEKLAEAGIRLHPLFTMSELKRIWDRRSSVKKY